MVSHTHTECSGVYPGRILFLDKCRGQGSVHMLGVCIKSWLKGGYTQSFQAIGYSQTQVLALKVLIKNTLGFGKALAFPGIG